jgi:hypothetical protein
MMSAAKQRDGKTSGREEFCFDGSHGERASTVQKKDSSAWDIFEIAAMDKMTQMWI